MKKIIAITFILLIGLMVLGGCASTTVEPSETQDSGTQDSETQDSEQQTPEQSESNNILRPPAFPED